MPENISSPKQVVETNINKVLAKPDFIRLTKTLTLTDIKHPFLHDTELRVDSGMIKRDKIKEATKITTKNNQDKTNLVDFLCRDDQISDLLKEAVRMQSFKSSEIEDVGIRINKITEGNNTIVSLDLSKPLTNKQKAEAVALVIKNIATNQPLIEKITEIFNSRFDRDGLYAHNQFRSIDYFKALVAAGQQNLDLAIKDEAYKMYEIVGKQPDRRKVAGQVISLDEINVLRELTSPSVDVFKTKTVTNKVWDHDSQRYVDKPIEIPEIQENVSVDLKSAQLMFNLFLPPESLKEMYALDLQIKSEPNIVQKEQLRHRLVELRRVAYLSILRANGVKGYEEDGTMIKKMFGDIKDSHLKEELIDRVRKLTPQVAKNMSPEKQNLSLFNANLESMARFVSIVSGKDIDKVKQHLDNLDISENKITNLMRQFSNYRESQQIDKAYNELWEKFYADIFSNSYDTDSQDFKIMKEFFLNGIRTQLGMTEKKPGHKTGYEHPTRIKLIDTMDQGLKGVDLLLRRTLSTKVIKSEEDFNKSYRSILQKLSQESQKAGVYQDNTQENKSNKQKKVSSNEKQENAQDIAKKINDNPEAALEAAANIMFPPSAEFVTGAVDALISASKEGKVPSENLLNIVEVLSKNDLTGEQVKVILAESSLNLDEIKQKIEAAKTPTTTQVEPITETPTAVEIPTVSKELNKVTANGVHVVIKEGKILLDELGDFIQPKEFDTDDINTVLALLEDSISNPTVKKAVEALFEIKSEKFLADIAPLLTTLNIEQTNLEQKLNLEQPPINLNFATNLINFKITDETENAMQELDVRLKQEKINFVVDNLVLTVSDKEQSEINLSRYVIGDLVIAQDNRRKSVVAIGINTESLKVNNGQVQLTNPEDVDVNVRNFELNTCQVVLEPAVAEKIKDKIRIKIDDQSSIFIGETNLTNQYQGEGDYHFVFDNEEWKLEKVFEAGTSLPDAVGEDTMESELGSEITINDSEKLPPKKQSFRDRLRNTLSKAQELAEKTKEKFKKKPKITTSSLLEPEDDESNNEVDAKDF